MVVVNLPRQYFCAMKKNMIKKEQRLLQIKNVTALALIVAAVGVVLQIIAGHPYPTVPPVFFILLLPAVMIAFGRWPWASFVCLAAAAFLTFGLFASGSYQRFYHAPNAVDSIGLWIQFIAVLLVIPLSITAILAQKKQRDAN